MIPTSPSGTQGRSTRPREQPQPPRSPAEPVAIVAGNAIGDKVLRKHRLTVAHQLDRDAVLRALGLALPKKPRARRDALKKLIADKLLLPTSSINIAHPLVAA